MVPLNLSGSGGHAGPATSGTGPFEQSQAQKFDSSDWAVNFGGAQVAGGMSPWLLGAAAVVAWLLFKK